MMELNVIPIFNGDGDKVLCCLRTKDPFKGKMNFVGGKVEPNESGEDAAYRELFEETGITRADVALTHVMDFIYYQKDNLNTVVPVKLEAYAGQVHKEVILKEEKHPLLWISVDEDFADTARFAGEANMKHIMRIITEADLVSACGRSNLPQER